MVWCDRRAAHLLGLAAGGSLLAPLVVADREPVRALLGAALEGQPRSAEAAAVVAGEPARLRLAARGLDGEVAVVASRLGPDAGSELASLRAALGDSTRAIKNLYAELDDQRDALRRNAEVNARVVGNITHDLRTPINSIIGLGKLLLSELDGPLTSEQEKQVAFILRSADELSSMASDLLGLATLDSGSLRLRPGRFDVHQLLRGLRGTLQGAGARPGVSVVIDPAPELPILDTDEGKLFQLLRNLLSNAIKFTERGEVRVFCEAGPGEGLITFHVRDTGIGIAPADQERIFEEFVQLDGPLQRQEKGAGLAVARRLAQLLGGTLRVESAPGAGATFSLCLPVVHPEVRSLDELFERSSHADLERDAPVLVVEDDPATLLLYEKYLAGTGFALLPARTLAQARQVLERVKPAAVILDVMLEGEVSWTLLRELKGEPATRQLPALVVTVADREEQARALGADEFFLKPVDQAWLLRKLRTLGRSGPVEKVLLIDDDEVSRYLLKRVLVDSPYAILEAPSPLEGLSVARAEQPDVLVVDFTMPGMSALELVDALKADAQTSRIPIILHTARPLSEGDRRRLDGKIAAVLPKEALTREVALRRVREVLTEAGRDARKAGHQAS